MNTAWPRPPTSPARITTPSALARTGWPGAAAMSTPWWSPRPWVRGSALTPKPLVKIPLTGAMAGVEEIQLSRSFSLEATVSRAPARWLARLSSAGRPLAPASSSGVAPPPPPPAPPPPPPPRLGAALPPLDTRDDGELPGALLVLADLVLELLDARLEGEVGPAEVLVL